MPASTDDNLVASANQNRQDIRHVMHRKPLDRNRFDSTAESPGTVPAQAGGSVGAVRPNCVPVQGHIADVHVVPLARGASNGHVRLNANAYQHKN